MAVFDQSKFKAALEKAVQADYAATNKPRYHMGASSIGKKCARQLWYGFRSAYTEKHTGRLLRLFRRGHAEEFSFVKYLRDMGAEVQDYSQRLMYHDGSDSYVLEDWDEPRDTDPLPGLHLDDVSQDRAHIERATARGQGPKQWGFSDHGGHFAGSTDGRVRGLEAFGLIGWGLEEFKTHSDKSFKDLVGKGVLSSKPVHYVQMQVYMEKLDLPWALYMAVNKNDDDLYVEVVLRKPELARQYIDRAGIIIEAMTAPSKLSVDPSWFECKFCAFREICHYDAAPQVNCRSCTYASPGPEGTWYCGKFGGNIPPDFLKIGCEKYEAIK